MSSIDGLVSGMNTGDIIAQLMRLERQPVARLYSRKTTIDRSTTALQTLNAKFASLAELAKNLKPAEWTTGSATSSLETHVGFTAAPGTPATTMTMTVTSLATAHKTSSAPIADPTQVIADPGGVVVTFLDAQGGTSSLTVTGHDGTPQSIAAAVNAMSTAPVTAAVVTTPEGDRLEFTAKKTGDLSRFDVSISKVNPTTGNTEYLAFDGARTVLGADAEIQLGEGTSSKVLKSSTNTIEVGTGMTVALKALPPPDTKITLTVKAASKPAEEVEQLVKAANAILKEIKSLTAYDAEKKTGGLLVGDSLLRRLKSDVTDAVSAAIGTDSAHRAGIQITRSGEFTFDKAKFEAAHAADPAAVAAVVRGTDAVPGIAHRLGSLATHVSSSNNGRLTLAIESRRNEVKRIDENIAGWDIRLTRREAALRRQFAAMEKALGAAQQQSNWLAGQIASLPQIQSN